jgi:acetyl esterase
MPIHLLTPRMSGVLDRIRRANRPPFHTLGPEEARKAYLAGAEILDLPRAALHRVEDWEVPAADGSFNRARAYFPTAVPPASRSAWPVLLFLHGGGFVVGGVETHDSLCRQLALRSGGAVVSLDYRLAPEHPFPAAWDDAWLCLQHLMDHAQGLGLDPACFAVGGDSAGGTLSAATALRARDEGVHLCLQLLITPGIGDRTQAGSRKLFARGFLLDAQTVAWFFDQTLPRELRHDPRFAPIEADDLDGVAPACVILAECDPVVDDGIAYADRLRMAGVSVDLEIFRGVTHDFMKMGRALPEALAAQDAAASALRQAWGLS